MSNTDDATRATALPLAPRLRIRHAVLAAFTLACFAAAPGAKAQPQPGEPTAQGPLADPAQAVAVEIAMRVEGGSLVCNPDLARLPANEELTLQLVNGTDAVGVFAAPDFVAASTVASLVDVEEDRDAGAFAVPAGVTGQIVLTSPSDPGEYAFACAPAGEAASAQGILVVEE
ncbi:cupredoxin domain-containing protein [Salinarimonas ramus]|uniref:EfeO-type cupredoxin-like domain-containing protein n=1 Tax=Salinarimonas ramus TaxID=690164 RepID=A0A917Q4R9_9HYPH|nr:cupredoxin domain-containing protein [Salinarimonas ramus]GGK22337.1 hypothetical protein GCM10011322_06240 [Salinarimonas ramus]